MCGEPLKVCTHPQDALTLTVPEPVAEAVYVPAGPVTVTEVPPVPLDDPSAGPVTDSVTVPLVARATKVTFTVPPVQVIAPCAVACPPPPPPVPFVPLPEFELPPPPDAADVCGFGAGA
tara:strand:- start:280 stop:636 length:357 start_codon:yes stop_codon:yes gene_type:complete